MAGSRGVSPAMTRGISPGMAGPSAIGTGVASAAQMKVSTETVITKHILTLVQVHDGRLENMEKMVGGLHEMWAKECVSLGSCPPDRY